MSGARERFHQALRDAISATARNRRQLAVEIVRLGPRAGPPPKAWEKKLSDWCTRTVPLTVSDFALVRQVLARFLPADYPMPPWSELIRAASREPRDAAPRAPGRPARPRQLRPAPALFTGRDEELRQLDRLLVPGSDAVAHVALVTGMAGAGKSALVDHWAQRVAARFPDGHLVFDYHGHAPERPAAPEEAMASLLESMGFPASAVPISPQARETMLRDVLSRGRFLVVLDNVASARQVSLLLPANPGSVVLVTSRSELGSLAGLPLRVALGPLPRADAVTLAGRIVGSAGEPGPGLDAGLGGPDLDELAELCGRLPLALWIAGRRLRLAGPARARRQLAALRDESTRLEALSRGTDPEARVRVVFSWTYRRLAADDPAAARVFRLLSLHPGATFRAEVVDVLTGGDGQAALDTLAGVHLVRPEAHRYAQHDLLRLYARELADRTDADADEVRHRLLTWYLDRVQAADRWITPTRPREPGPPATAFPGDAEALAWLEEERGTLVAVTEEAARRGETDLVSELALFAVAFFDRRYHLHEWIRTLELAVETADRADDRSRLPAAVYNLAGGYRKVRRFAEAEAHYRRFQEQLDPAGEQTWRYRAASRYMLGNTLQDQRRFTEAETEFRAALDGFTGGGAAYEAAHVRLSLGDVQRDLTRYGEAEGNLRDALDEIARREREAGKGDGEALARWALAVLLLETGRDEEAAEQAGQSLRLARANHNVDHEGWALLAAAAASRATGRPDQAAELLREAEDLFTRTEDRYRLALALAEHARTHLAVGRAGPAHRDAARAIDLLRTWDDPQARHVSDGLARDRDSWPAG